MPETWQQQYSKLTAFIAKHPEVNIGKNSVHIPRDIRADFYSLFDNVRMTFLRENFSDLIDDASILVRNYTTIEKDVISLLGLKCISTVPPLCGFLQNPSDELIRGLFDILFDLLQKKTDPVRFKEKALLDIKFSFNKLTQSGYEKWVILSLIKLLDSDKLFGMNLKKLALTDVWKKGLVVIEDIPVPQESNNLQFHKYSIEDMFIIPDAIVHSALLHKYVSFRAEIGLTLATASKTNEKREWYSIDTISAGLSGLTLIYLAAKPEEISLVADVKKICKPDMIIACAADKECCEAERLERVKYYHNSLKPGLGTYIITKESVPEKIQKETQDDIRIIHVGLEQSALKTIVDALLEHRKKVVRKR